MALMFGREASGVVCISECGLCYGSPRLGSVGHAFEPGVQCQGG